MSSTVSGRASESIMCSGDKLEKFDDPQEPVEPEQFFDFLYRDQRTVLTTEHIFGSCRCPRNQSRHFKKSSNDRPICQSWFASGQIFHHFAPWRECLPFRFLSNRPMRTSDKAQRPVQLFLRYSRKRINMRTVLTRLGDVLLLGVCLLSLVRLPSVMSAPFSRDSADSSTTCSPDTKWKCPCGYSGAQEPSDYDDLIMPFDENFLKQIILAAKIALTKASEFKEEYVYHTFGVDYHRHHKNWLPNHLSWLPNRKEMPKQLGESLSKTHLENLNRLQEGGSRNEQFDNLLNGALGNVYEFLQKIAVGLEQVVKDQFQFNGEYKQQFEKANQELLKVLCEIQIAIEQRKITTKGDVSRVIMKDNVRNMDNLSHRNVRDWLIFREYMNVLEYVIAVFEYIQNKYKDISKKEDY